eukprot:3657298-Lingulodinium_polyedra.AAC.1
MSAMFDAHGSQNMFGRVGFARCCLVVRVEESELRCRRRCIARCVFAINSGARSGIGAVRAATVHRGPHGL